jgi:hypothetical protein
LVDVDTDDAGCPSLAEGRPGSAAAEIVVTLLGFPLEVEQSYLGPVASSSGRAPAIS